MVNEVRRLELALLHAYRWGLWLLLSPLCGRSFRPFKGRSENRAVFPRRSCPTHGHVENYVVILDAAAVSPLLREQRGCLGGKYRSGCIHQRIGRLRLRAS